MPSGRKKRLRAKRKKQGSPATDANSDRETEALSVTGSVDVDDLESGLDTPTAKVSSRPASLDREAVSSQTDEWVRVSDFDVGTPTSQTEENDPSTEDGDTGSSRRSLDKLAEWETVSGEHIPGRQDGSIQSVEEEPSECEAASAHSSESYTNLPSPHVAGRDKDGDSSDSDMKNRLTNRSSCCSTTSRNMEVTRAPASAETFDSGSVEIREGISSPSHVPSVEETGRLNIDSFAEKIVRGTAPGTADSVHSDETKVAVDDTTTLPEETIIQAPDIDDQCKEAETLGGPVLMEANPEEESHEQVREEVPTASSESGLAATNPDEQETISANGKDISEVGPLRRIPVLVEEAPQDEKEVLPDADESLTQRSISGESGGEESAIVAGLVDGDDKVDTGGKIANPTIGESAATDDEEVASTSADVEDEKIKDDAQHSEVSNFVVKSSFDPQELIADSVSVKAVPTSETSEHRSLSVEGHHSHSTPVEKNGTEKRLIEAKSSAGCCGVLYWLLGWDN